MRALMAALARLFLRPKSGGAAAPKPARPKPYIDAKGERLMGFPLTYLGDTSLAYGRSATARKQPYQGIVAHHPVMPRGSSIERLVQIINTPRADGHMYGYHFVIDTDGRITQAAPLTKRVNQIKGASKRRALARHLTNRNAIGISFHLASHNKDMAPSAAQTKAGKALVRALEQALGRRLPVYGHGEIQTDKQKDEGRVFAQFMRGEAGK